MIKEAIAGIGENIQIRRFERFVLGEGIEVAKADLAADVEAQTKAMQVCGAARPQSPGILPRLVAHVLHSLPLASAQTVVRLPSSELQARQGRYGQSNRRHG